MCDMTPWYLWHSLTHMSHIWRGHVWHSLVHMYNISMTFTPFIGVISLPDIYDIHSLKCITFTHTHVAHMKESCMTFTRSYVQHKYDIHFFICVTWLPDIYDIHSLKCITFTHAHTQPHTHTCHTHTQPHTQGRWGSPSRPMHLFLSWIWVWIHCLFIWFNVLRCVAVCCNVLQCVAVCCSVLQCVAVCGHDQHTLFCHGSGYELLVFYMV